MPTVPQTLHMRRRRTGESPRLLRRLGLGCGGLISLGAALVAVAAALAFSQLTRDLPSVESLPALVEPPYGLLRQATRLYDRSGTRVIQTLQNPAAAEAAYLRWDSTQPDHLPAVLGLATVALSDPGFWEHAGYSMAGLRQGSHPTLAQRLVADLILIDEPPGLQRSLRERLLAAQVTRKYGREKILEWYLNSVYYGHMAYGADAAARVYLGKPATDLTLAEAAYLAAVAEAPALNPFDTPAAALDRQRETLNRLLELGLIDSQDFRQARRERLAIALPPARAQDPMAPFIDLVHAQLIEQFGRERLERGGLRVVTSLDYDLQIQLDCTLRAQTMQLTGAGPPVLAEEGDSCEAARLLPTLNKDPAALLPDLASAAVVMAPASGQILALAGEPPPGVEPRQIPGRPPGTLLTPFVHLSAYTRGLSPASLAWDIPSSLPVDLPEETGLDFRGPMRLRSALNNDRLAPTLQILAQMGPEVVWRTTQQLGLSSLDVPAGESAYRLLLDEGQASLLELTHTFGIFSQQGVLAGRPITTPNGEPTLAPVAVLLVEDLAGRVWLDDRETISRPVISAQLAYLLTDVLSDEVNRWPSLGHPNPLEIGRPAGAKTGRAHQGREAWTVGFTPQLAVGVWFGPRDSQAEAVTPVEAAAGAWHAVLQYATRDLPPEGWSVPPGISQMEVCDPSGMLPTADCPSIVREVFLNGNEPTHTDTLFRKVQVNRETGRLATVFTPPELVDERVYLMAPPEAEEWAAEAGLPTPPDSYDLIILPGGVESDLQIRSPEMFAYVRGQVPILGSASGDAFAFYRLQFGQGLNPQTWTLIGEESRTMVENGSLGVWDTGGLSGLFALRLQVVRSDQRVDTATVQVTVDNQPPEISILYPEDGQRFSDPREGVLTVQLQVSDNLALERVEVFVDNQRVMTLTQPPYAVPWELEPGDHTLLARATDLAGNSRQVRTEITVLDSAR